MTAGSIIRLVVALALIPFCYTAAVEFGALVTAGGEQFLFLLAGAVAYLLVFLFFHKTIATLVLGRATVHKAWGTITGFRRLDAESDDAKSATLVDSKGRAVPVWALLAPYVIPLHAVVAVLAVWIVMKVVGMSGSTYMRLQSFLLGLTYAFHLFMLFRDVREKRADVRAVGYTFTLVLVFLVNIEILALLGWLVFDEGDWIEFNRRVVIGSQNPYRIVFEWIRSFIG